MNFRTGIGLSNRVYGAGSMPAYLGYAGQAVASTGAVPGDVQVAGQTLNPANYGKPSIRAGYLGIMPLRVRGFKAMSLQTVGATIPADYLPPSTSINVRLGQVSGVGGGWGSLWDVVTGKEAARGEDLNWRIQDLNAQKVELGQWTQAQAAAADARLDDPSTYRTQVGEAFVEGAAEGLAAEQAAVRGTATGLLSGTLGFIPWWVWVGGLGYAAWYLGLLSGLRGSLSPKARTRRAARRARRGGRGARGGFKALPA